MTFSCRVVFLDPYSYFISDLCTLMSIWVSDSKDFSNVCSLFVIHFFFFINFVSYFLESFLSNIIPRISKVFLQVIVNLQLC